MYNRQVSIFKLKGIEEYMKKVHLIFLIFVIGIVLCACGQKSSEEMEKNPEKTTPTTSTEETSSQSQKIEFSKEIVSKKLKRYIPQNVLNDMPDFKKEEQNDKTLFLWSKSEANSDNFIHKVEFVFNKNGIKQYHYQNYSFNLKKNHISKNDAAKMVKNFAKDFINDGELLTFVNKPAYDSLYEKNVVESWVSEKNNQEYIVMVNLNYGYIEFFTVQDKSS